MGARRVGCPKFRAFFSFSSSHFDSFFSLSGDLLVSFFLSLRVSSRVFFPLSGGLLVEFWWCFGRSGPQMCLFSPSGCRVEAPGGLQAGVSQDNVRFWTIPHSRHTTTTQTTTHNNNTKTTHKHQHTPTHTLMSFFLSRVRFFNLSQCRFLCPACLFFFLSRFCRFLSRCVFFVPLPPGGVGSGGVGARRVGPKISPPICCLFVRVGRMESQTAGTLE